MLGAIGSLLVIIGWAIPPIITERALALNTPAFHAPMCDPHVLVTPKSDKLLQNIFNKSASEEINLSLLLFLTQVNYLQYVLTGSVAARHYTLFKVKYVLLYHLVSSLEKLRNDKQAMLSLSNRSTTFIDNIILDVQLADLVSKRQFRNILVHFGIPPALDGILSSQLEFYGIVEHFFNGNSFSHVLQQVDYQLSRVSQILEEWLDWEVNQQELKSW